MTNFTKGPWVWQGQILVVPDPNDSTGWEDVILATLDDIELAEDFIGGGGREWVDWHCNEANAALIAAAPELYEALQLARAELEAVLHSIEKCKVHFDGDEFHERLTAINAALAKAEGSK